MARTLFFVKATALIFAVAGTYLLNNTYLFIQNSISMEGEVIEIKTTRSESVGRGRPGLVHRPLVRLALPDGGVHEFIPKVGSHRSSFRPGENVEVLYKQGNPGKAVLKSFETTWLFPVIMFGISALLIAVAILLKKIMPSTQNESGVDAS